MSFLKDIIDIKPAIIVKKEHRIVVILEKTGRTHNTNVASDNIVHIKKRIRFFHFLFFSRGKVMFSAENFGHCPSSNK